MSHPNPSQEYHEQMTCAEFYESYMERYDEMSRLFDEMYWEGGVNTDQAWRYMQRRARELNVELIDADTFDYDKFLYNAYKYTEKGLS